jgi:hypothetical protein
MVSSSALQPACTCTADKRCPYCDQVRAKIRRVMRHKMPDWILEELTRPEADKGQREEGL